MTPVYPYLVRKSEDGWRGELLLRLRHGKSAYIVHLSMEQARLLAVEMRGLATDYCPQHHLALEVAQALGGRISHLVLTLSHPTGEVAGVMRVETPSALRDVNVDPAAALAMAIHMGMPIFMDGDFPSTDGESRAAPGQTEGMSLTPIPEAFRQVIEGLDQTTPGEEPLG